MARVRIEPADLLLPGRYTVVHQATAGSPFPLVITVPEGFRARRLVIQNRDTTNFVSVGCRQGRSDALGTDNNFRDPETIGHLKGSMAGSTFTLTAAKTVASISKAAAGVVTVTLGHGFQDGDIVTFAGCTGTGWTGLNGAAYSVTRTAATTFTIPEDTSGFGTLGGTVTVRQTLQAETLGGLFLVPNGSVAYPSGLHPIKRWTSYTVEVEGSPVIRSAALLASTGFVASTKTVTTATAHGFSIGDKFVPTGGTQWTEGEGIAYTVSTVPSTTTFTIEENVTGHTDETADPATCSVTAIPAIVALPDHRVYKSETLDMPVPSGTRKIYIKADTGSVLINTVLECDRAG